MNRLPFTLLYIFVDIYNSQSRAQELMFNEHFTKNNVKNLEKIFKPKKYYLFVYIFITHNITNRI